MAPFVAEAQAALAAARATLNELEAARSRVRELQTLRKARLAALRWAVYRLGNCAVVEFAGDRARLLSVGLEVAKPWSRKELPGALTGLRAARGPHPGSVLLRWKSSYSRNGYTVQIGADASGVPEWRDGNSCTRARMLIEGLEVGKTYWFRVRPVSARGEPPWSAPLMVRVG